MKLFPETPFVLYRLNEHPLFSEIDLHAFVYQNLPKVEQMKTTFLPLASRVFRQCIKSDTSEEKHKQQFNQSKSKDVRVFSKKDVIPEEDQHVEQIGKGINQSV